jgi:uncharacterized protein YndB with AHSA1/START domain
MSERSTTHSTFVIERDFDAPPARVLLDALDAQLRREPATA